MLQLNCVGLNHRIASVDIREQVQYSASEQVKILAAHLPGIHELVILSTCNRTEFYALGEDIQPILDHLLTHHGLLTDLPTYNFQDQDCVTHLMRVAAGLDSLVIGEPEILGQIMGAYQTALDAHAIGPILSTLMQHAIRLGKRARHQTQLSTGAISISAVVARYAEQITGSLQKSQVLIVGAGVMGKASAASIARRGVEHLIISGRTLERAEKIASYCHAKAIPYLNVREAIRDIDVLITATSAPTPLFYVSDIAPRDEHPLLIFDIGLPRNVDPEIGNLPNVRLFNIDDLRSAADAYRAGRENAIPEVEAMIAEAVRDFERWQHERAVVPIIQDLQAQADTLWRADYARRLDLEKHITEHQRRKLEIDSQRQIKRLLHKPILWIKQNAANRHTEAFDRRIQHIFSMLQTQTVENVLCS